MGGIIRQEPKKIYFTAWYRTVNRMSKRISFLPVFDKYGAVFYTDSGVVGVGSTLKNALYVRDIEGIGYVSVCLCQPNLRLYLSFGAQITQNAGW